MEIPKMKFVEDLLRIVPVAPDDRTREWPLMDLNQTLYISLGYVVFSIVGRQLFNEKTKWELKAVRVLHNALMTFLNLYMVIEMLRQASKTSWYGPITRGEEGLGVRICF